MKTHISHKDPFSIKEKGSTLIATLTVLVIMSMGISSILLITSQEYVLSKRSINWNQAIYTAESGVEYGWNEMNKLTAINSNGAASFMSGWVSIGNSTWTNSLTLTNSYGNEGNSTIALSMNTNNSSPAGSTLIKATGTMNSTIIGTPVSRNVQALIIPQTPFNFGILSRGTFNVNGNAANFNSWNSNTAGAGYSAGVQRAHSNIGTDGLLLNLGGLNLMGSASTGPGGSLSGGNIIQPVSPDTGVNSFNTSTQVSVPSIGLPIGFSGTPTSATTLTTAGDYTYTTISGANYSIGNSAPGQSGLYRIYVTGDVNFNGSGGLTVTQPSDYPSHVNTVQIYVAGSIILKGNANINTGVNNRASQLQVYGLPTCTSVTISGTTQTQMALYAPDAAVTMNGGGNQDFMGSIVSNSFTAQGNIKFHYDEALANIGQITGYTLTQWREY